MNPRDTELSRLTDVNVHRLIRLGTTYGPPYDPNALSEEADEIPRGAYFLFISAKAMATIEFLQQEWINDGNFIGVGRERDPTIGLQVKGATLFRLELQRAQEGDPVDDPSAIWPHARERVVVGRLDLLRPITEKEIGDPEMMHDPTAVTDGIEVSSDDQIIAARRGAYLVSLAERTGGWQRRGTFGANLANGAPEPALAAAVSLPLTTTVSKE